MNISTINNKLCIIFKPEISIYSIELNTVCFKIDDSYKYISKKRFIKKYSPYQVGGLIEVECGECEGTGNKWILNGGRDPGSFCSYCFEGYQSKPILSIELKQAEEILDDIWSPLDINKQNKLYQEFVKRNEINSKDYLLIGWLE